MQFATNSANAARNHNIFASLASAPAQLLAWIERRRRVSAAIRELSWHTDRELSDLGVNRGEIVALAEGRSRHG